MIPGFPIRAFLVAAALLVIHPSMAQANELAEKFFGSYVGSGTADILATGQKEDRDLDVTIESFKEDGFTLKWITVIRGADGARTGDLMGPDGGTPISTSQMGDVILAALDASL